MIEGLFVVDGSGGGDLAILVFMAMLAAWRPI
jgi:hypothetical protein